MPVNGRKRHADPAVPEPGAVDRPVPGRGRKFMEESHGRLQTDRRVPRGLGPEHEVPLLDQHAEAMFRYYHEPPTLAEHAELVQSDPLAGVPARGLARLMLGRHPELASATPGRGCASICEDTSCE